MNYASAVHKILDLKAEINKQALIKALEEEDYREAEYCRRVQNMLIDIMKELKDIH